MQFTVQELAHRVAGRVLGAGDRVITAARPLDAAGPNDVTFAESERYLRLLPICRASAVVVPEALVAKHSELLSQVPAGVSLIVVSEALAAFVALAHFLRGESASAATGIDATASVHPTATIGVDASVGAFAVVGEGAVIGARCRIHSGAVVGKRCRLGDDVTLHAHALLCDDVVLGQGVIIHAHAVVGVGGFVSGAIEGGPTSFATGTAAVGSDVEIGAGSVIDCGSSPATSIGSGTKIDNLVVVGPGSRIGEHNILCSQVGVGAACATGHHVILAGQAAVADHVRLGSGSVGYAKAGIEADVPPGLRVHGVPARSAHEFRQIVATLSRAPEMRRALQSIRRRLAERSEAGPEQAVKPLDSMQSG